MPRTSRLSSYLPVRLAPVFLLLLLAAACATPGTAPPAPVPPTPPAPPDNSDLWVIYDQAVRAAMYPEASHVSRELVPILRSTPGLRWDARGRVLMATWTKRKYYDGKVGQPYTLPKDVYVWLTAVPRLQEACRGWGLSAEALPLRIAQALGMPPPPATGGNDAFVQVWIDPADFFRPCPDPEITDRECQVTLGVGPVNRDGGCPWPPDQVSSAFVRVSGGHLAWMCQNWESTFQGKDKFPWTALGYTFDWGDLLRPVGQSEYVAPPGRTVVIESISTAQEYCRPAP